MAGAARAARDPSYAAVALARRSDLATRIQSILDGRVPRGSLRRAHATLLAGAVLLPAELNPRTVVLAGYSDDRLGLHDVDLTQTGRTFFLKLGYALLL